MAYSGAYGQKRSEPEAGREPEPETEWERPGRAGEAGRPPAPANHPRQGGGRPSFDLSGLFKKIEAAGMETDDLLMALILYLMYRESGDKDLLIMLAAMLLT